MIAHIRLIHSSYDRYKAAGSNVVDTAGTRDFTQFINVATDDVIAYPAQARRAYPTSVNARMLSTIAPFVEKALVVNNTLIDVFNDKLGLPRGTFAKLHPREAFSGSATRCVYNPPVLGGVAATALSAHTGMSTNPL